MKTLWHWLTRNASSAHHRVMARYLRKRGWVVFYLDSELRTCKGGCWLTLYQSEVGKMELR